jgi:dipeptidyl-peptidase-4
VISADGQRIVFLQSTGPRDSAKRLMQLRIGADPGVNESSFAATVIADPAQLSTAPADLSPDELARRERLRESGSGIVAFATDQNVITAAFSVAGSLGVADLISESAQLLTVTGPVIDPRVDPTGTRIAWVADRSLYVADINGDNERCVAQSNGPNHSWGLANFLAAEEFDRIRGFWWSPDGQFLLVEEVDDSDVTTRFISDPANPATEPRAIRYPAAGTANPRVRLWLISVDGRQHLIDWDPCDWEYVVSVAWSRFGPALVTLYDRPQQNAVTYAVDADVHAESASVQEVASAHDDRWVADIPGTPCWDAQRRLITTVRDGDSEGVAINGRSVTIDAGVNVSAVLNISADGLLLLVSPSATSSALVFVAVDGQQSWLTPADGFHTGQWSHGTLLTASTSFDSLDWERTVSTWEPGATESRRLCELESMAMRPPVELHHELLAVGNLSLNAAIVWPRDHRPGSRRLPVIMNPYGGPHAQRVLEIGRAFASAQWLADQGFAVVIADGRGSPGRGPEFEREISGDLATFALADQVDVITSITAQYPDDIDAARVGITGWSFGGYLAALAVLKRPDVFRAAVAGAPVTDWRLYDTAYTERYLGDPAQHPERYDQSSLTDIAATLTRPLLIIHGLADDNVLVAHSLRLSSALTAAGRAHSFLPLSNVTHMTPQVEVAENLQLLELEFLKRELNVIGARVR